MKFYSQMQIQKLFERLSEKSMIYKAIHVMRGNPLPPEALRLRIKLVKIVCYL